MAGGRGTRIASLAPDIPKPMIRVGGKPVLQGEIESLARQGIREIILTVGHMSRVIQNYFGDGSRFGVNLSYYEEEQPLGSAGALYRIRDQLTEDFLLLNGDAVFSVNFSRLAAYHREKGGLATLLTHPNDHPYDSGLIITGPGGAVERWLAKEDDRPEYYQNRVNAGIHILSPRLLDGEIPQGKVDLDRQILKPLAGTGKMFAYDSPEYVKDMGTPERYAQVCQDIISGRVEARNLLHPQKAVFLDRDGTVNRYVGFLRRPEELELLPGAAQAVRRINQSGYLAILVTNQPVIARGEVTYEGLRQIHNRLETLLGQEGAFLDAIYFCPHHPDKGFPGEIPELKVDCPCRKPKPGLLLDAARDYGISLPHSIMVGDRQSDVLAGRAAGCRTALLGEGDFGQDETYTDLLDFSRHL